MLLKGNTGRLRVNCRSGLVRNAITISALLEGPQWPSGKASTLKASRLKPDSTETPPRLQGKVSASGLKASRFKPDSTEAPQWPSVKVSVSGLKVSMLKPDSNEAPPWPSVKVSVLGLKNPGSNPIPPNLRRSLVLKS
ncbi:hypothetical protein AVEN_126173-1 [Araneus ventricosus]|uniref:Uncharacterized protein n=1 Tax=Araneus ventricosus TaxID=182803 RepID=A0A4Y2FPY1_ARAVE|nr:hypothetical protein AVEN_126173-1 [Araneus ventricosus]